MTSPGFAPRKYAEIKINPDRTKSRLRCRAILVSFVRSLLKKLFINYTPSVGPRPKGLFKERVAASRPSRGVSSQLNIAAAVAPEGVPLASWLRLCGCVTAACRTSSMGCARFLAAFKSAEYEVNARIARCSTRQYLKLMDVQCL